MSKEKLLAELASINKRLDEQAPRPLTLPEAADYLGISRSRLYFYTSESLIPHFKPTGKKIYFQKADLDAFILRNRVSTREELAANV